MPPMYSSANPPRPHWIARRGAGIPHAKAAGLAALFLTIWLLGSVDLTRAATLVPHQAHYRLSLLQLKIPGEAATAGGDLALRVERTCSHWRILSRFNFSLEFRDRQRRMRIEVVHGMEEDLDGRTLLFESHSALNGEGVSIKGTASIPEAGGVGRAVFTAPQPADIALPEGTLFPTATVRRTVDALEHGLRVDSYFLFDGSNPAGSFRASDVVGGKPLTLKRRPVGDANLLNAPSWRVTSAFFDHRSVDAGPLSTTVSQLHANGVVSRVLIDVGPLVADAELVEIKSLPLPSC